MLRSLLVALAATLLSANLAFGQDATTTETPAADAETIISDEGWTLEWFEENGLEKFLQNVFDH